MTKLTKVLSTGAVAGLILTGQVAQLTTVFAEDYTENIQQAWDKSIDVFRRAMLELELTEADNCNIKRTTRSNCRRIITSKRRT